MIRWNTSEDKFVVLTLRMMLYLLLYIIMGLENIAYRVILQA